MGEVGRLNVSSPGNAYAATINLTSAITQSTATVSSFLVVSVYWDPADSSFTYQNAQALPKTSGVYDGSLWGTRWSTDFSNYRGFHYPLTTGDPCARNTGPTGGIGVVTSGSGRLYKISCFIIHVYTNLTTSDTITITGPTNLSGPAISNLRILVHWYKGAKIKAVTNILPGFDTVAGNTGSASANSISDISLTAARQATGLTLSSGNGALVYTTSDAAVGTGRTCTFTADTTFSPDWVEDYPATRLAVGSRQFTSSITSVSFSWTTNSGAGSYNWSFFPWDTQTIYAPDAFTSSINATYVDIGSIRRWTVKVVDGTGLVGYPTNTTNHIMVCYWRINPMLNGNKAGLNGVFDFGAGDGTTNDGSANGQYLIRPDGNASRTVFSVPAGSTYHFEAYLYDGILSSLLAASLTGPTPFGTDVDEFTPLVHHFKNGIWNPSRIA